MAGVEAGLQELNVKDLRAKAAEAGVDPDQVEAARDGDNPNADIARLIAAKLNMAMPAQQGP